MKKFNIDEKQLEFLGNFFSTAAKNVKQFNDFTSLFELKKTEDNELIKLFKKFYCLNNENEEAAKKENDFSNSFESFQKLVSQYLSAFNFADNSKIKELEEKCKNLEKELEDKNKEIKLLKSLIEQSSNQSEIVNNFQKVFIEQGKEFQNIMDKFGFFSFTNKNDKTKE